MNDYILIYLVDDIRRAVEKKSRPAAGDDTWRVVASTAVQWANGRIAYSHPLQIAKERLKTFGDTAAAKAIAPSFTRFLEHIHALNFLWERPRYEDLIDNFARTVVLRSLNGGVVNSFYLRPDQVRARPEQFGEHDLPVLQRQTLFLQWENLRRDHRDIATLMHAITNTLQWGLFAPAEPSAWAKLLAKKTWISEIMKPGRPPIRYFSFKEKPLEGPVSESEALWTQTARVAVVWQEKSRVPAFERVDGILDQLNQPHGVDPRIKPLIDEFLGELHTMPVLMRREEWRNVVDRFIRLVIEQGLKGKIVSGFYDRPPGDVRQLDNPPSHISDWNKLWLIHPKLGEAMAAVTTEFEKMAKQPKPGTRWQSTILQYPGKKIRDIPATNPKLRLI